MGKPVTKMLPIKLHQGNIQQLLDCCLSFRAKYGVLFHTSTVLQDSLPFENAKSDGVER